MRTLIGLIVLMILALGAAASTAVAGEPTREEYVRTADAICKPVNERGQKLFRRGDRLIERGHQTAGANLFIRVWRSYNDTTRNDLRPLAPPPGDARSVDRWLDLEIAAATTMIRAWNLFKDERYGRAVRLGKRGERIHDRAHRAVKGFDFRFCA